jgi:uncharacterized hydrophobic protein (TIGR00271 family)
MDAATGDPILADPRQSLGAATLDDLFPEGDALRASIRTYVILLALAALIASFGLYQDSVAAIIGAMVVAPLGGAIMAFAGALVTARTRSQVTTFLEIALGGAMVVAIGFVVSLLIPDPLDLNPSLDARTAPGLLDLGVALSAGAAGAYVAARRMGTDALPGVAIAVSLVPPLATVGICLELGRLDDAAGAGLLFLTNFSAITVVASVVFILTGAKPIAENADKPYRVRNRMIGAVILLGLIAIPLAWRGFDTARSAILGAQGAPVVRSWIGDRDLAVVTWSIAGDDVVLELMGSDRPGDTTALATSLAQSFGSPVNLRVEYAPTERSDATGTP